MLFESRLNEGDVSQCFQDARNGVLDLWYLITFAVIVSSGQAHWTRKRNGGGTDEKVYKMRVLTISSRPHTECVALKTFFFTFVKILIWIFFSPPLSATNLLDQAYKQTALNDDAQKTLK